MRPAGRRGGWRTVVVPHTWQIEPDWAEYYGAAWYRRAFEAPREWQGAWVRVEFQAILHSANVWLNGRSVGEHLRKGYTAFAVDVTNALRWDEPNLLVVRVDNSFDDAMLPRGRSSDWTHDGGIYRPVAIVVSPPVFIERLAVEGVPKSAAGRTTDADVHVAVTVRNTTTEPAHGDVGFEVIDERSGEVVLRQPRAAAVHTVDETFGIRSFEAREGGLFLNGERVRLMGVERMAGSHPDHGMAEPASLIEHDHADMKDLNSVLTRVHWMQDRRVLDYCDRHGILMQLEVPTWGPDTFKGMAAGPLPALMENGLEQLREMIEQNRNHPSVVVWGLCNEIGGQNPPANEFARRMREEAKRLDPRRPAAYASNSLQRTPERDVTALMDIVEWNEYYESWFGGTLEDLRGNVDAIHRAFPDKPIVVSEYGYCACTPERPEGDGRRIDILKTHTEALRAHPAVAGLIFFCYNDYRTHIGDRGKGALKQRVHGVVDLYGAQKPSYDVLRGESSPVEALEIASDGNTLKATLRTRGLLPACTLTGYRLRWIVYSAEGYPVEQRAVDLPDLAPGGAHTVGLGIGQPLPARVQVDVLRPTGFSARSVVWTA